MESENFLQKAKIDLETATWAFEQNHYDICARASYFAVFHAEIAALISLADVKASYWGHDFVQAEFARQLIHLKKVFPQSLANTAPYLIGYRHKADYSSDFTSQKIASRCFQKAESLLQEIIQKIGETS